MRWNQSSPFQLESEIIHGTFSTREKNVNHIVAGVSVGAGFCSSPSPSSCYRIKFLSLFWSGPKPSKLWTEIFLYEALSRKNISKPHLQLSLSENRPHFIPFLRAEPFCRILEASLIERERKQTKERKGPAETTSESLTPNAKQASQIDRPEQNAQWLINISKNHQLFREVLVLSYKPPKNHSWSHPEVQKCVFSWLRGSHKHFN